MMRAGSKYFLAWTAHGRTIAAALAITACSASVPNGVAGNLAAGNVAAGAPGGDTRALLDVVSTDQARVLALITAGKWLDPSDTGAQVVKEFSARRPAYTLLPSIESGTSAAMQGRLQGSVRDSCGELFTALATESPTLGFAVAGANEAVQPLPLHATALDPAQRAAVAGVLQRAAHRAITPTIEAAYSIDLDGNGKPEVVVQATHPDLATDFADYLPDYYSILVVLPDSAGADPVYTGYVQATQPPGSFQVLALDAVADVDADRQLELLVRARHAEGFQLLVFRYQAALKEVFHSLGGESNCEGMAE